MRLISTIAFEGGELDPVSSAAFLTRYQHFFDGLITGVHIDFVQQQNARRGGEAHRVNIECSVIDTQLQAPDNWVSLILSIEGAYALRLIRGNQTWVVLSEGISIGFFDQSIYFAFDEQVQTLDEFLQADFLVVGERCTCSVLPHDTSASAR